MARAGLLGDATNLPPPGISTGVKPMKIIKLMAICGAEAAACIAK